MPAIRSVSPSRVSFLLICLLLFALVVAGGASRADVMGQVITRTAAWLILACAILFGQPPRWERTRFLWWLLSALLLLCLLQLIPLPPDIWAAMPGRAVFREAALASGSDQPWRPLAIVPGTAINTASSLIVPFTTLTLVCGLSDHDRRRLPAIFVILVAMAALAGLLQVSGAAFRNPLINDIPGLTSGPFANRNHFALLLAVGCLAVPTWTFSGQRKRGQQWSRAMAGIGLTLLLPLLILATGSRAGILLGALALGMSVYLYRGDARQMLRHLPPRSVLFAGATIFMLMAGLIAASVLADRAESVTRALAVDTGDDMRVRALPTVLSMIATYFPFGAGFGGFDQLFRIHEPFQLLRAPYFNHAHNDVLEVALDAGLPGILLMLAALGWWSVMSVRAWRNWWDRRDPLPVVGSTALLLIAIASVFDYPARTPLIMATMVLAAIWLSDVPTRDRAALPSGSDPL